MPLGFRRFVSSMALLGVLSAHVRLTHAQGEAGDIDRLVEALALAPGAIVAEIGAGDGTLTVSLARRVGAGGRVFTTELGDDRLRTLRQAIGRADLSQIEVVEARATSTNLADACCDAIVMRDVYHHFGDPAAMNASLLASLKSGGRLAVLDFGPPPGKESDSAAGRSRDGHHGVGRQTVSRELEAAGFTAIAGTALDGRRFMVVGRKP
jgi:cyclopropane fatty-acyl-phospholipid synthase-like methyltransferase